VTGARQPPDGRVDPCPADDPEMVYLAPMHVARDPPHDRLRGLPHLIVVNVSNMSIVTWQV
jgi:hypothetical protein